MKISILTIGDEICIGQVANTNAVWIAENCTKVGGRVIRHTTVGDVASEMKSELDNLLDISDMVIITGGLGPTHDDITKPVLTEYFNDTLVYNSQAFDNVSKFLVQRNIPITEKNTALAYLPSKCKPLWNNIGTASGMLFKENDKTVISLPGVPREMKSIMTDYVIPLIEEQIKSENSEIILFRTFQTTGIPESTLADKIGDVSLFLDETSSLAFLPSYKGVRLRVGVIGDTYFQATKKLESASDFILSKVAKYIYSQGEATLSSVIGKLLSERKETISIAESCTGGLLSAELTANPGSSKYFIGSVIAYNNQVKINEIGVSKDTLDKYGAVSSETAIELAENIRAKYKTDYSLSITGIAGPDGGTEYKPVGTVWIGFSSNEETISVKYSLGDDRAIIRERAVSSALTLLYRKLTKINI